MQQKHNTMKFFFFLTKRKYNEVVKMSFLLCPISKEKLQTKIVNVEIANKHPCILSIFVKYTELKQYIYIYIYIYTH